MNRGLYILILLLFFLFGCSSGGGKKRDISDSITLDSEKEDLNKSANAIFYNMFLPCEMIYIFEETGIPYQPGLINPVSNLSRYTTNNKKALNLGIYGVDMGYIKIYRQVQELKEYSVAINKLSNDLGIPQEHITYAMDYLDKHVNNIDSMFDMTCELFEITDSYLNRTERESTSAMIILGGWIEALYITTNLMDGKVNQEIMDRIARQKYSLNSIISLLKMNEDNLFVTNYLVMLNKLRKAYQDIEIYFSDEKDILIDTVNKRIYTDNSDTDINIDQFIEIKKIIRNIRRKMVE